MNCYDSDPAYENKIYFRVLPCQLNEGVELKRAMTQTRAQENNQKQL